MQMQLEIQMQIQLQIANENLKLVTRQEKRSEMLLRFLSYWLEILAMICVQLDLYLILDLPICFFLFIFTFFLCALCTFICIFSNGFEARKCAGNMFSFVYISNGNCSAICCKHVCVCNIRRRYELLLLLLLLSCLQNAFCYFG